MAHKALAAHVGIGGDARDTSLQIDTDREEAIATVMRIVRERMTPELVAAIGNPQSGGSLEFELHKALGNIEKWFRPKQ